MPKPHSVEQQLAQLGLELPSPPKPVASYIPWVRTGDLIYISGQIPMHEGALIAKGVVPSVCSLQQATAAARQCALNALAVAKDALGGNLDRISRIVRLGVFVASDPGFTQQPEVANGASDLMVDLFGERGRHARAAVGSVALPRDASVEVEMIVEVDQVLEHLE
ncbi:MAG: RidA family protein [Phycisphaerales bacterium]